MPYHASLRAQGSRLRAPSRRHCRHRHRVLDRGFTSPGPTPTGRRTPAPGHPSVAGSPASRTARSPASRPDDGRPARRPAVCWKQGRVRIIKRRGAARHACALHDGRVCSNSRRGMRLRRPGLRGQPDRLPVLHPLQRLGPGRVRQRVSRFTMTGDTIRATARSCCWTSGRRRGVTTAATSRSATTATVRGRRRRWLQPRTRSPAAATRRRQHRRSGPQPAQQQILRLDRLTRAPPRQPDRQPQHHHLRQPRQHPPHRAPGARDLRLGPAQPVAVRVRLNTGATRFYINDVGQNTPRK